MFRMFKRATVGAVAGACLICSVGLPIHATHAASTTITWLVRTDPVINPWEKSTVAGFEKLHPDINVQLVVSPPNANYDQKLLTMVASGNPPAVFSHWGNDSWADFAYRGILMDLSPFIKSSHFSLAGMDPALIQQYSINGDVYGIPFATGGSYVFYNADLLKAAGIPQPTTDWNDKSWTSSVLMKDAQTLTKNPTNPSKAVYGLFDNLWPENANTWLFGGDIFPASSYKSGVVGTVTADSPAMQKATQWQSDIILKSKVAPSPTAQTALSSSSDPFLSGRIALEMTGPWGFWVFAPAKFKWGAAPLPTFTTHKDVYFTDPWVMSKGVKDPQAAWTFLEYLASPQYGDKTYVATSGVFPPWSQLEGFWADMMSKRSVLTKAQLLQLGKGGMAAGGESINHLAINYGQFDSTISNVLQPVWTGSTSPQKALSDLQSQLTSDISKAGIKPGGYVAQH